VRFLGLFVKLALQTNKKLCLKSLQWGALTRSEPFHKMLEMIFLFSFYFFIFFIFYFYFLCV
jgi:hypothetical protein